MTTFLVSSRLVFLFSLLLLLCRATFAQHQSDDPLRQLTFTARPQSPLSRPSLGHAAWEHAAPATPVAVFDPLHTLRHALDVMQSTWFELWVGTWPEGIDWTRAVFDTHLVSALGSLSKALHHSKTNQDGGPEYDARDVENEINRYFGQDIAYYFGENAFNIRYQAYDDMLWVVLGWLESIKFINRHSRLHYPSPNNEDSTRRAKPWYGSQFVSAFAHRARVFWDLTTDGWDTKLCGGGMTWNPDLAPYKNAITNQLFITASADMYLYFPGDSNESPMLHSNSFEPIGRFDTKYLNASIKGYDWLANSGMTNKQGLYVDGFHIRDWKKGGTQCNVRNEMVYTYNQGVLLSGLRSLWESTGNATYLTDAHKLARAAIRATGWHFEGDEPAPSPDKWAGLGRGGILEDRCDAPGRCSQDAQTFKGIFMHHLTLLCEPLPLAPVVPGKTHAAVKDLAFLHRQSCLQYSRWVERNARAALATRDGDGRFGSWWGAREGVEVDALPLNAIDHKNDASELLKEPWTRGDGSTLLNPSSDDDDTMGNSPMIHDNHALSVSSDDVSKESSTNKDLNDRGRGRTVETQSGGVAVLVALYELLRNVE